MRHVLGVLKKVSAVVVLLLVLFMGYRLYVNNFQTIPSDGLCSNVETGEWVSC
jgi:hypothetical protein